MKEYWFQRRGSNKRVPVNWKGWALFAFVIGTVVGTTHWSNNPLINGICAVAVAGLGYWLMDLKRVPDGENAEAPSGRKTGTILLGCALGLVGSLLLSIAVMTLTTSLNKEAAQQVNTVAQTKNQAIVTSTTAQEAVTSAPVTVAAKPAVTDTAKSTSNNSVYQTYQNPTMRISSMTYPKTWTVSESADKLSATFDTSDKHVDVTATLYAGNTSYDLQTLFSDIQQGAAQNGFQISQHQVQTINGNQWLTYNYETQSGGQTFDDQGAVTILSGNNQRQFIKFLLESNAGYFSSDLPTFDKMLESIVFSN